MTNQFNEDISNALKVLKNGGIILYPTDTIWGIGCDVNNTKAIERIFSLKKRNDSKSMIILLDDAKKIPNYVSKIKSSDYETVYKKTKLITIIFPGAKNLSNTLINEDGSIGIRITKEKFSKSLVQQFGHAIVSTSANKTGNSPPKNFSEIDNFIIENVDYVVKYRQNEKLTFKPSKIIRILDSGSYETLRS